MNLQQKTKIYLTLSLISLIIAIAILGTLNAWGTGINLLNAESLMAIGVFMLTPIGFLLLAIGTEKKQQILRLAGILFIVTEFILIIASETLS